jgi:hypothetical protein
MRSTAFALQSTADRGRHLTSACSRQALPDGIPGGATFRWRGAERKVDVCASRSLAANARSVRPTLTEHRLERRPS